ncbi:MAG: hypothetical protein ACOCXM_03235 [Myxococcota bacterium]
MTALPRIVPHPFTAFLEHVAALRLSPAQAAMWRVLAGEAQPHELEGEEREAARHLFGGAEELPPDLLSVCAVVKGARIGGSLLLALRLLDLAMAVPLEGLASGELAFGVIVAPDLRLAAQAFRYVTGAIDASPALQDREIGRTTSSVTLVRDDGRHVQIECLPATRGGSALRGRTLVGAVLDEAAFFQDESYTVNDAELYRAVRPRVVPGGQVLISSTPWAESGLLYELFSSNFGNPQSCVAVHAPTRLMRTDAPTILAMVASEEQRDPDNAAREYGAEFMGRGTGAFFDPVAIDQCIRDYPLPARPEAPTGERVAVAAGVDAAFVNDACTCIVAAREGDRVRVLCIDEIRPEKGSPLSPSAVVARWVRILEPYGVLTVHGDQHYYHALREALIGSRIVMSQIPGGQQGKREIFETTRTMAAEGRLVLPRHRRLVSQLREIMAAPTPGGGMTIKAPRKAGSHGDLVSALVAVCHALAPHSGLTRMQRAMDRLYGDERTARNFLRLSRAYSLSRGDE